MAAEGNNQYEIYIRERDGKVAEIMVYDPNDTFWCHRWIPPGSIDSYSCSFRVSRHPVPRHPAPVVADSVTPGPGIPTRNPRRCVRNKYFAASEKQIIFECQMSFV